MKAKGSILIMTLLVAVNLFVVKIFALSPEWLKNISPVINGSILCFENIKGETDFYIGTDEGMYWTRNAGEEWEKILLPPGIFKIYDIVLTSKNIFILCEKGIYKSDRFELFWKRVSKMKGITGIASFLKEENEWAVFAWSGKCFYEIDKNGMKKIGPKFLKDDIQNVSMRDEYLFWTAAGSVFILDIRNNKWDEIRLFSEKSFVEDDDPVDKNRFESELNEDTLKVTSIKDMSLFSDSSIIILDSKGIHVLDNNGRLKEDISVSGLPLRDLVQLTCEDNYVFAASDGKVFLYSFETKSWQLIFETTLPGKISRIGVYKNMSNGICLWVAADKNLYRKNIEPGNLIFVPDNFEKKYQLEALYKPSIKDVQKMAIDYAEVNNDKIKKWRNASRWKAVFPKFSISFSESIGDNVEIYKSATTAYVVSGPKEKDNDWDFSLSWDFSDLIWNDAQTSIDVRSKLMVQLREEILEEVTRLYFERIKILLYIQEMERTANQMHACGTKGFLENLQKLHEVTAYIDALTGGEFSEAIKTDLGT
ncbi:MAG: hypothetical protein ABIH09_05895 [Candidatus Omnitrophota bacterium]